MVQVPTRLTIVRTKMKSLLKLLLLSLLIDTSVSFTIGSQPSSVYLNQPTIQPSSICLSHNAESSSATETAPELKLSESEQKVYVLLEELHNSELDFRVVVVGNGAILETTAALGPKFKISESPSTPGQHLVTFAAEDASFEFHVKIGEVSKVAMVEKVVSDVKTLRILRMVNEAGKSICSLILADQSDKAAEWYQSMMEKYGPELTV